MKGTTPEGRFWARVDKAGECWLWTPVKSRQGYGRFRTNGRRVQAHRFAYELLIGPIPDGLTIDHTCHTADLSCPGGPSCPHRACVNPDHLEAVTLGVNVLRRHPDKPSI